MRYADFTQILHGLQGSNCPRAMQFFNKHFFSRPKNCVSNLRPGKLTSQIHSKVVPNVSQVPKSSQNPYKVCINYAYD